MDIKDSNLVLVHNPYLGSDQDTTERSTEDVETNIWRISQRSGCFDPIIFILWSTEANPNRKGDVWISRIHSQRPAVLSRGGKRRPSHHSALGSTMQQALVVCPSTHTHTHAVFTDVTFSFTGTHRSVDGGASYTDGTTTSFRDTVRGRPPVTPFGPSRPRYCCCQDTYVPPLSVAKRSKGDDETDRNRVKITSPWWWTLFD